MVSKIGPGVLLVVLSLLTLVGCGDQKAPLTGTVVFNGRPLEDGVVYFFNARGGPTGYAKVQSDGKYSAKTGSDDGLLPGEYRIAVKTTKPGTHVPGTTEINPQPITPVRYTLHETSGLTCIVPPQGAEFAIVLQER